MGLRCDVTQCHQWWIFAFRSKEIYEKAVQIYRNNQREIDKAVEEIIIKKYHSCRPPITLHFITGYAIP